ncbi:hypothetical protein ACH44C_01770 [Streptomyces purpureus]|uniref:hypothetical protein n=1 Tax=Streptomyces purpureus TaxID=1951 RepID=UPI0003690044|nr:hypothetical protein [Streptomyces purpureus]
MKASDIASLPAYLAGAFADVTAASVALSGSLSRGDARIAGGRVLSDLDLIPVVDSADDVTLARKQLEPVLRDLADHYAVTCTAAITLRENFLRARHAGYVTSMRTRPFLCDPLGLQEQLDSRADVAGGGDELLPWLAQPVTYYLAKAGATRPGENLAKAALAARRLVGAAAPGREAELLGPEHGEPRAEVCLRALRAVTETHRLTLLPSSREFLARRSGTHDPEETFHAVRDRAFLENQGLPFAQSAMAARPSA